MLMLSPPRVAARRASLARARRASLLAAVLGGGPVSSLDRFLLSHVLPLRRTSVPLVPGQVIDLRIGIHPHLRSIATLGIRRRDEAAVLVARLRARRVAVRRGAGGRRCAVG